MDKIGICIYTGILDALQARVKFGIVIDVTLDDVCPSLRGHGVLQVPKCDHVLLRIGLVVTHLGILLVSWFIALVKCIV